MLCSNNCQSETTHYTTDTASDCPSAQGCYVSEYYVPKMDCPSEEGLIRMALDGLNPAVALEFDTPNRRVRIVHGSDADIIAKRMDSLDLGAALERTCQVASDRLTKAQKSEQLAALREALILRWLLAINSIMFGVEFTVGWWAQSTGLIADSLDMFADAAVYGVALYAVGHSMQMKLKAAHLSGWLQIILAIGALSEVVRRFVFGSEPVSGLMMSFGLIALVANVLCLMLIAKSRDSGAHMKASWIFSANDVIANAGVIVAGFLVAWTGSRYPDLITGLVISVIILNGARRILKLKS